MLKNPRWLLVVAALLLFGTLGYAPFWNPDEGRYASASLEMIGGISNSQADWVVPHLNTIPRLNKPPLVYWLAGSAFKIFGPYEWAGRLGAAFASLAVMLILWQLGRAMFDEKTGIAGALIWATSLAPAAISRTCNTDMLLAGSTTIVFWGIWLAIEQDSARWRGYFIAGIGMGLSMLAKGPVGVALPILIGFIYIALTQQWRKINWLGVALAVVLTVLISAPWFIAIEKRQPGFTYNFIIAENLGRFQGGEDFHKKTPIWFYVPVIVSGLLPWTAFLYNAVIAFKEKTESKERHSLWFLWLWALFIVLFFSVSKTKLFTYVLPSFPALSLLLGYGILRFVRNKNSISLLVHWLIVAIGVAGLGYYLLNDKSVPRSLGGVYFALAVLVLVVPTIYVNRFWKSGEAWKVLTAQFAGGVALSLCLLSFAGKLSNYEDASAMFRAVRPYLSPEARVIQTSSFQPTAIFYDARPIYFVNFVNTSGLEEKALQASPYFPEMKTSDKTGKDLDLSSLFESKDPVFVMLRWRREGYSVPRGVFTWARNNDYKIVSNRPCPPDFHFDYTAPFKAAADTNTDRGLPPRS